MLGQSTGIKISILSKSGHSTFVLSTIQVFLIQTSTPELLFIFSTSNVISSTKKDKEIWRNPHAANAFTQSQASTHCSGMTAPKSLKSPLSDVSLSLK